MKGRKQAIILPSFVRILVRSYFPPPKCPAEKRKFKMGKCVRPLFALFALAGLVHVASSCDEAANKAISDEVNDCITKATNTHHSMSVNAQTKAERQKLYCQMLTDMSGCSDAWSECLSPADVRSMKDARIEQFLNYQVEGIDTQKCNVVQEYVNSGRAQENSQNSAQGCSSEEYSTNQRAVTDCTYKLSGDVWQAVQDLEDAKKQDMKANNIEYDQDEQIIDPETEAKPLFCSTLQEILVICMPKWGGCLSDSDIASMGQSTVEQMRAYFTGLIAGVDMERCPNEREISGARNAAAVATPTPRPRRPATTPTAPPTTTEYEEDAYSYNPFPVEDDEFLDYPEETNDIAGPEGIMESTPDTPTSTSATPTSPNTPSDSGNSAASKSEQVADNDEGSGAHGVTGSILVTFLCALLASRQFVS